MSEPDEHRRRFEELDLDRVEVGGLPPVLGLPGSARVVAFNAERGSRFDEIVPLLTASSPDVLLLSEVDHGMARSGQRHVTRELAEQFGHQYAFGVEYLELGLGSAAEREQFDGQVNEVGHHGGAITAACALAEAAVVRLECSGYWFDPGRGEPRVGGRMAVVADVVIGGTEVAVASVHLHSHGDPSGRADELSTLIDALDERTGGGPAVIGGDLNTHTFGAADFDDPRRLIEGVRADPGRLLEPLPYEPLFDVARERGFEWEAANVPGASTARGGDAALRLDWFLARGVEVSDPEVIDATGASDHDAIAITIQPRPRQ